MKFDPALALRLSRTLYHDPSPSDADVDRASDQLQAACGEVARLRYLLELPRRRRAGVLAGKVRELESVINHLRIDLADANSRAGCG